MKRAYLNVPSTPPKGEMSASPCGGLRGPSYLICVLIAWLCLGFPTAAQGGTVWPERLNLSVSPDQCELQALRVTLDQPGLSSLDVAFVIDVTASMREELDSVTRSADRLMADIEAIAPDVAFGLATLADYPAGNWLQAALGRADRYHDQAWSVVQDFTQDGPTMRQNLAQIALQDGGDDPEAYLRALYEAQNLPWRANSRRVLILFGDAPTHQPDPGPDAKANTEDDLNLNDILAALRSAHMTVLAVYSGANPPDFYRQITDQTGGQLFLLADAGQIPEVIPNLLAETLQPIQALRISSSQPGWVQVSPTVISPANPTEAHEFQVQLCPPANTPGGEYQFDLQVLGDEAPLASVPVTLAVSGPPENWNWWWLLLLPLLLLPIWWYLRQNSAPVPQPIAPNRRPLASSEAMPPKPASRRGEGGSDITYGRVRPPKREI